jgi:hypothetical protein
MFVSSFGALLSKLQQKTVLMQLDCSGKCHVMSTLIAMVNVMSAFCALFFSFPVFVA